MADLDQAKKLQEKLFGRQQFSPQDMVNYAASKTLDQMMERLQQPHVSAEEFQSSMKMMGNAFRELYKEVKSLQSAVEARPDSFDPVVAEIKSLANYVQKLVGAVSAIRLPEPPPFPEIPQPKDVDLSPVLASQDNIVALIAAMGEREEVEEKEEKPRKWTFDVKRNQSGLIRSVEVNEQ